MKEVTIKCDICGRIIDHKEEKFFTFEVPGVIDLKKNEVLRYETHFCESHQHIQLMLSHSDYELQVIRALNDWLKANRWIPST